MFQHDARKAIFSNNLKFIEKHNAEEAIGLHTFTVGVNQFADLTNDEFVKKFTAGTVIRPDPAQTATPIDIEAPDSIDWREKVVTKSI